MTRNGRLVSWVLPLILLVAAVCICMPLMYPGFFVSDDGGWMIIRLSAFYQSLRDGQFPVRFLGRLNFGYGYPVANFLYPGFLYIGSFIHILGFRFIDTVKLLLGGSVIAGALFTYLWLKKYFDGLPSLIGSAGFILAPYLLFDIYHRGSVGEVLAIAVAGSGLYAIKSRNRWLFGLVVPLLILSHNTLALLFLALYAVYITFLGLWPEFWLMFGTGVGMAAFFWLPAIYERKFVVFDMTAVANPRDYFISPTNIALLGIPGIAAGFVSLFVRKELQKEKVLFLGTMILTLFLVLPVSAFIWNLNVLAHIIQFPYRFLSLTIFAGAWLTAYVTQYVKNTGRILLICLFVSIGVWTAASALNSVAPVGEPEGFYTTNEATTTVADEYMPIWVATKPATHAADRFLFYKGRGVIHENYMNTSFIDITVQAAEESVVQINTVYYPGWGATMDDTKVRIDYTNSEGVIRIHVPAGQHHLVVAFRETISRFLADILSLCSLVFYVVLLVAGRYTKRKKS